MKSQINFMFYVDVDLDLSKQLQCSRQNTVLFEEYIFKK